MVQLVSDGPVSRPSTLMIGPIKSLEGDTPVVGYVAGGFSWDDVLSGTLSMNYDMDCVISTSTGTRFGVFFVIIIASIVFILFGSKPCGSSMIILPVNAIGAVCHIGNNAVGYKESGI